MSEPSDREIHWRDYVLNVDLYKFYLEILMKANVYYYGITGALASFCLTQSSANYIRWVLLLPMVMSLGLGLIFAYSWGRAIVLSRDMERLSRKILLEAYHDFSPLVFLLIIFTFLQATCFVGLGYLLWKLSI